MNLPTKDELKTLLQNQSEPCISLYMPTHRVTPETKQDPIRFKNQIKMAEEQLKATGLRSSEAKKLLKPAKALIKDVPFWQYQADGLAAFISPVIFYHYRLPITLNELLVVTNRFHIKPLLPLFSPEGWFYILALSQNAVRFFQCTRYSVKEMEPENIPRNLNEALQYDDPEKQLQFHTRAPAMGGQRAAMFHGQGAGTDEAKKNILRYFQQIDHGLQNLLIKENAPLVLAGVDFLFPIFKEASSYPLLMAEGIPGNPENLKEETLHKQAWEIVEPCFLKTQEEAISQYRQLAGNGRTSNTLKEIIPKAYEGRIDVLFVAVGVQQWGVFDPGRYRVDLHSEPEPADEDLLDFATVHSFLNGGTVYALRPEEMPEETPIAAIYRY
jgi:hypothetical protein